MPIRSMAMSMVVVGAAGCCIAGGEEIRWVASGGGSWHDAANWDLGRVPGDLDRVIIDLPGRHTISFCGGDTYWTSLTIINGDITLDACGDGVSNGYLSDYSYEREFRVGLGADRPTSVVVTNGKIFTTTNATPLGNMVVPEVRVGNQDGSPATLTIDPSAEVGIVHSLAAVANGRLIIPNDVPMAYGGGLFIHEDGFAHFGGTVGSPIGYQLPIGDFLGATIRGELCIEGGGLVMYDSALDGNGRIHLSQGGRVHSSSLGWVSIVIEGRGWVSSDELRLTNVSLDVSQASGSGRYLVCPGGWLNANDATLKYGMKNIDAPVWGGLDGFLDWALPSDIVFESDEPLPVGTTAMVGY
ncbi:MAG: hypothetical protein AAGA55_05155 [Planctomycetota bacterium]